MLEILYCLFSIWLFFLVASIAWGVLTLVGGLLAHLIAATVALLEFVTRPVRWAWNRTLHHPWAWTVAQIDRMPPLIKAPVVAVSLLILMVAISVVPIAIEAAFAPTQTTVYVGYHD
jgi:hypothetical protein